MKINKQLRIEDFQKINETEKIIDVLKKVNDNYSDEKLKKRFSEAFYYINQGLATMELDLCREYMSEHLYYLYKQKVCSMKAAHEKSIIKNVELVYAAPVSLDMANETLVFRVKGAMINYTVDAETEEFLYGNKHNISFYEYWKVIVENNNWVIDEIEKFNSIKENESSKSMS